MRSILTSVSGFGGGDWVGWTILISILGLIGLDLFGNVRARLRMRLAKRRWRDQLSGPQTPGNSSGADPEADDWSQ